ncbi:hypothetical protein [Ensifer aridi]|uniref:hypothetical protein n=1 Tax=Ensifer aridi TaxID=1708715 RepID=UPI000425F7CA|nr:hypothetical protein [Ensifer aridi]
MQFTPGQVKEVLDLGEETLRYWRRVLPGLSGRRGYAPCFGFHDVVCLRFVKEICTVLGLQVSKIVPVFPELRRIVAQSIFSHKDVWFLAFDPATETVTKVTTAELSALTRTVVIIPANVVMDEVRSNLLGLEDTEQPALPFPLVEITGARRG